MLERRQVFPYSVWKRLNTIFRTAIENNFRRSSLLSATLSINLLSFIPATAGDLTYTKGQLIDFLKSKGYQSYYAENIKTRTIVSDSRKFFFELDGKNMLSLNENRVVGSDSFKILKGKYGRLCADVGDGELCYYLYSKAHEDDSLALVAEISPNAYIYREFRKIEYRDEEFYDYKNHKVREFYEQLLNSGELKTNIDDIAKKFEVYMYVKWCVDENIVSNEILDIVQREIEKSLKQIKNMETKDKVWNFSVESVGGTIGLFQATLSSIEKYKTCDRFKGAALSLKGPDLQNPF